MSKIDRQLAGFDFVDEAPATMGKVVGFDVGGESTMVVPAYYISMNVTGSGQGLCLFGKFKCFTAVTGPVFGIGVLLACVAVALMAAWRRAPVASERGTPLMEEVAAPSGSARIRTAAAAEAAAPPTAYMGE